MGQNRGMNKSGFHLVSEPGRFDLKDVGTTPPAEWDKEGAVKETEGWGERMESLLDLLYFAGQNSLLIVLQGMDAAGKDGTIRHLLRFSHAQSCRVASFKVPTEEELAHDFLWRCHAQTPRKGEIVVFNRSHYEDVGVVRVKGLVPEEVWKGRYDHINAFESLLTDSGTIILKVFLHISPEEQLERLKEREEDQDAYWKLSVGDWKERKFWDAYQEVYSDAIGKCASKEAPWVVVPADKKWWRNLVVTRAVVEALEPYEMGWRDRLESIGEAAKAELAVYRQAEG